MPVIPPSQSARIREIQDVFWRSLDDALDTLDDGIADRARLSMEKIRRSGYSRSVIRRETRKITAGTNDATAKLLAQQVQVAALYAQRAADVIRAWQISGRLKEGVEHLTVSDSALARARLPGASAIDAEAALARIQIAPLKTSREVRKILERYGPKVKLAGYKGPKTAGMKVMEKLQRVGLVRKSREVGLSQRLHGAAARNVDLTNKAVNTAIREASNMNKAGRDIINLLNSEGSQLSVNRKLTKPLLRLKRAARKLQKLSVNQGDPDALKAATKEFNQSFKTIRQITQRRVDARGGYLELKQKLDVRTQLKEQAERARAAGKEPQAFRILKVRKKAYEAATKKQIDQWVSNEASRRTDKALSRWLDEKQAYHSERIVETETSAAYRAREYQQHANKPYIVGFWWRRNPGMVALDLRRKRDIAKTRPRRRGGKRGKRKTKGRPCRVCPALADQRFPVEYAREYPRGAHPMCRCWYEWIYDRKARNNMPVTQQDLDWYEGLAA